MNGRIVIARPLSQERGQYLKIFKAGMGAGIWGCNCAFVGVKALLSQCMSQAPGKITAIRAEPLLKRSAEWMSCENLQGGELHSQGAGRINAGPL